jgi:RHS repeat-associated protein
VATIEGRGTATTTNYVHADHLGGTNVISNASGVKLEVLDYYPYGGIRLDEKASFNEPRKFTGHEYDGDSGLSYMRARYYDGGRRRFLGQDPVFLGVGDPRGLKEKTGLDLEGYLFNPQMLNSYGYAAGNPLKFVDKKGEFLDTIADVGFLIHDAYNLGRAINKREGVGRELGYFGLDAVGSLVPFATGLSTTKRINDGLNIVGGTDVVTEVAKIEEITKSTQGGVCSLTDPATGNIVRTGRSNNLQRRAAEHARDSVFREFNFEPLFKTDSYVEQRGLEQVIHNKYLPSLNKINPVSPQNRNYERYIDAARKYLSNS